MEENNILFSDFKKNGGYLADFIKSRTAENENRELREKLKIMELF